MAGMDQRVRAHLIGEGIITEQGLTRTPKHRRCPTCREIIYGAIDDLGLDALASAWPVTVAAELAAHMAGRRTWSHVAGQLVARYWDRIETRSANDEPVHVAHTCGIPPPETNTLWMKAPPPEYTNPPF